jgi:hypothetical protein
MLHLVALSHFVLAWAMAVFANWIGLIPWRRAANAHWTERARLLWPVRFTAALSAVLIPIILGAVHHICSPDTTRWWILNAIAALLGVLVGRYRLDVTTQVDLAA